jgi:hypothetical protein
LPFSLAGKARFFEKSGAKTFGLVGPVAAKPAWPSLKKSFLLLFVYKKSLPLRFDMICPKCITFYNAHSARLHAGANAAGAERTARCAMTC